MRATWETLIKPSIQILILLNISNAVSATTRATWRFRLRRTFFGLTPDYMENVYEQFFFLKYSGGWSLAEAYNLPVGLRKWFVERLIKQLESEKEAIENASKGGSRGSQTHILTEENSPQMPKSFSKEYGQG